jgi:hypothetical protein
MEGRMLANHSDLKSLEVSDETNTTRMTSDLAPVLNISFSLQGFPIAKLTIQPHVKATTTT